MSVLTDTGIDVLLTDIRMPGVSGLELMQWTKKMYPHVKIIILSGYDDFSYAKEAIACGALDYVLKPTDITALERLLRQTREKVVFEHDEIQRHQAAARLQRELFFNKLFGQSAIQADHPSLGPILESSDGSWMTSRLVFGTVFLQLATSTTEANSLLLSFLAYVDTKDSLYAARVAPNAVAVICGIPDTPGIHPNGQLEAEKLACMVRNRFHPIPVCIGISSTSGGLASLAQALRESRTACSYASMHGKHKVINFTHLASLGKPGTFPRTAAGEMRNLIETGAYDEMVGCIDQLYGSILPVLAPSMETVVAGTVELLAATYSALRDSGCDCDAVLGPRGTPLAVVGTAVSLEDIRLALLDIFIRLKAHLTEHSGRGRTGRIMQEVQRYLQAHCTDSISLIQLAQEFNLSEDYLSRAYSKETGESVVASLARYRIMHAKELIRAKPLENLDTIALEAGFKDPKYFFRVFKKIDGHRPSEFRRHLVCNGAVKSGNGMLEPSDSEP
jgi:two-component system response regulator YesN